MSVTAAYLKLTSQKMGEIKGTARQRGREGQILVMAVNHEIISPKDAATGLPSGKRQHQAIVITKEVDNTTPQLHQILVENSPITDAVLTFYGTDPTRAFMGTETELYCITLHNVFISRIELALHNLLEDQKRNANLVEKVSFVYHEIEWKWTNGNIIANDTWSAGT
jgi:type VI secretion system secreted protein Hcp